MARYYRPEDEVARHYRRQRLLKKQVQRVASEGEFQHYAALLTRSVFVLWTDAPSPRAG